MTETSALPGRFDLALLVRTGLFAGLFCFLLAPEARAQWRQWGGPGRDFHAQPSEELARTWRESGPKEIWTRGFSSGGCSTLLVDEGVLFTLARDADHELTLALDARTGKSLWEARDPSPVTEIMKEFSPPGPHSTPLLTEKWIFAVGANSVLTCRNRESGAVVWRRDLHRELGFETPRYGYASSPIRVGELLIVSMGKEDLPYARKERPRTEKRSVVAFEVGTGKIRWRNDEVGRTYSSGILIQPFGESQVVIAGEEELFSLEPSTGRILWRHGLGGYPGINMASPVWDGADRIFCSAAYDSGSRVLRLARRGEETVPEELWLNRKAQLHHGNAHIVGETVFFSSGERAPAFLMALDLESGTIRWRERGFGNANLLRVGDRFLVLDEDGELALVSMNESGLTVHSRCGLLGGHAWAAPTLVGTTLYLRDSRRIVALDLR